LTDRTEALMTPFWEVLTTPVFSTIEPGVTAVSPIAGLAVLVLGWAAHRVLRKKAATFAGTHPEWPEERVKAILTVGSTAMGLGTVLTAFQVAGFSLDTIHFVWRLFNAPLLVVAGTDVSVVTILTVCGVVYGGFWVSDLSQRGVKAWAGQRHNMEAGTVATVQRLLHYLVVGLSGIVALQTIGIKLDALLATGAVFAVGFGLAMQGIAQNFVSGIILLLERSIRPGDVVEVDETMVRVEEMAVRSTIVVSLNGDRRIVPNSVLVQSTVRNLTMGAKPVRVHTRVGVAYHLDPDQVTEVLLEAGNGIPQRIADRPAVVHFANFGDSALEFDVFVWINEPWFLPEARHELNRRIWSALKAHDMPIPFPQRTVHLQTQEPPPPPVSGRPQSV
jgi:small-conductance mechanosensitive channel